jgi:predicted TIM-barrel fold metal-dependent hydrolase
MEKLEVVDSHHHLWDLALGWYDWLVGDPKPFLLGDYTALRRNYLPEDYRTDAFGVDVLATVHVEAECIRSRALDETRWLHEQHASCGMPQAVVAHAWLHDPRLDEQLAAQAQFPLLRGLRSKPLTAQDPHALRPQGAGSLTDPNWLAGMRLLAARDWSWDLRVPFWHLEEAAMIVEKVPELRVVLNHTGLPWDRSEAGLDQWRKGMRALARLPKVFCKISELGLMHQAWTIESNRRVVQEAVEIFGPERCMFASNFPVASLRVAYRAQLLGISNMLTHLNESERRDIFVNNAISFYRIKPFCKPDQRH